MAGGRRLRYNDLMRVTMTLLLAGLGLLVALPAAAQVEIQSKSAPQERPARIVTPPLHYETSKPPDHDFYPSGPKVGHDPAFIEPLAIKYETPSSSGRVGLSGWTAPNQPVAGAVGGFRDVSGWFALGFSVTWDGPPPPKARPR
jgi:hypothetical protein